MDKARHFIWVADAKQFVEKQDLLIGIGSVYQQNRYVLLNTLGIHSAFWATSGTMGEIKLSGNES